MLMPVYKIHHITQYTYDRPVRESVNEIRIYPYSSPEQEALLHEIQITGNPKVETFNDYWGNKSGSFSILPSHNQLTIESKLVIRTTRNNQLSINFHSGMDELQRETRNNMQLLVLSEPDAILSQESIREMVTKAALPERSVAAATEFFSEYIFRNFKYKKGVTGIETTVDEILEAKGGVCQDFTHLMLQLLRTAGIPARYVSGYICPNKNGMRGEGATHAWVEAWIPGFGWAGIDPTNNCWVTNNHIKLSVGRDFKDCTPVKGAFKGPAHQQLSVFVSVGYEDGHTFEDINNVQLELQQGPLPEIEMLQGFAQQQ